MNRLISAVFYGNIFYGLCTVTLCIETNLKNGIALNSLPFYLLVFLSTVVYYSRIYFKTSLHINSDQRTTWYRQHRSSIKTFLLAAIIVIILDMVYMLYRNFEALYNLSLSTWFIIAMVLIIGNLYTFKLLPLKQLRNVGWLKPFIIGFVWAGIVTIFPIVFWHIKHPATTSHTLLPMWLLWLQNFSFITALAILFDIKDHDTDKQFHLRTFPATIGIQNTIYFAVVPLAVVSYLTLFVYQKFYSISQVQIIIQTLPYLALLVVIKNLGTQKNLLFYLAAIDGLMLFKAICGIISISIL